MIINKNLQERINIAPLVDLKERENSDELYKKWLKILLTVVFIAYSLGLGNYIFYWLGLLG